MKNATKTNKTQNGSPVAASTENKTMNATITQVNPPRERSDWNKSRDRFTVYTDGKARHIADLEYFTKYDISSLNFKCASWGRVGGFASRIEASGAAAAIEARFGVRVDLKFSRTAGCSCGCSPGFIGKILDRGANNATDSLGVGLSRASLWVNVPVTADDAASIVAYAAKQASKLPAEIEAGNSKVAVEKAARAAEKLAEEQAREERRARWSAQEQRWAEQSADESLLCAAL